jgi:hypothetical protein
MAGGLLCAAQEKCAWLASSLGTSQVPTGPRIRYMYNGDVRACIGMLVPREGIIITAYM